MKPVIGYTLGDQSGIGPEVIFAALASGELPEDAEYRLIGKRVELPLGRPNAESAKHAFDHLEQAAHALREGTVDAVVTAPSARKPCMRQVSAGRGRRNSLQNAWKRTITPCA